MKVVAILVMGLLLIVGGSALAMMATEITDVAFGTEMDASVIGFALQNILPILIFFMVGLMVISFAKSGGGPIARRDAADRAAAARYFQAAASAPPLPSTPRKPAPKRCRHRKTETIQLPPTVQFPQGEVVGRICTKCYHATINLPEIAP